MDDARTRTPGRPRQATADDRIVRAAAELLREQGPGAVNVAAVAGRSGIARTTIYRRYRDRGELLGAALAAVTVRGAPAEDMSIEAKLRWVLDTTEEVLEAGIGMGGVASVLTGADPEFAAALRGALSEGLRPIRDQVAADVERGRLSRGVDPDALLSLVLGAYLAEVLLHGPGDGRSWRDGMVEQLHRLVATDDFDIENRSH